MSLLKKILQFKAKKMQFFTTPSHAQGRFKVPLLKDLYKLDFSEMDGLDNLREPKGIIKNMLNDLTKIYGTKQTFALINGSSSGNIAAMITVLGIGDKVLIVDNCHVSVQNGVKLTHAEATYVKPLYDKRFKCPIGLDKEEICQKLTQNQYKMLVITCPTYEGASFELNEIIEFAHSKGVKVLVDEAHGALFPFSDKLPKSAIDLGADFVVQSLHKTAGGVNPSALLHICNNSEIEPENVQKSLNLINTTSPSYPLLISIEEVVKHLHKNRKKVNNLIFNIEKFKQNFGQNVCFLNSYQICMHIENVDMVEFTDLLYKKYKIECEICTKNYALFYCGLGTDEKKLKYLQKSVEKVLNLYQK